MRAVTDGDILELAAGMRRADRQEIMASSGPDILATVRRAVASSTACWSVYVGDVFVMIGGVAPLSLLGSVGSPWMLGTEALEKVPGALTRVGIQYLQIVLGLYPELVNYVDARNIKSIRWLRRLGFTIADQPIPYGLQRLPFYRFEMRI